MTPILSQYYQVKIDLLSIYFPAYDHHLLSNGDDIEREAATRFHLELGHARSWDSLNLTEQRQWDSSKCNRSFSIDALDVTRDWISNKCK